jgi:hypothetical protein
VFATRAPYRPNPIGLSLVSLRAVAASKLVVGGFDLVDGTPVYDIKPWLPWADLPTQEGSGGFASQPPVPRLMVGFDGGLADDPLAPVLARVLAFDPRPAYQRGDADRIYGMDYAGYEIQWRVDDLKAELQVTAIRKSVDKVPE